MSLCRITRELPISGQNNDYIIIGMIICFVELEMFQFLCLIENNLEYVNVSGTVYVSSNYDLNNLL